MSIPTDAAVAFPEPKGPEPDPPGGSARASAGADAADRRRRDIGLARAMAAINYNPRHPLGEQLVNQLASLGAGTLINMWKRGRLFAEVPGSLTPPGPSWALRARDFIREVASEAAVAFVATKLKKWDPDGGAALDTYFITYCLFEFKKQYQADARHQHELLAEPAAPELTEVSAADDPARTAIQRVTIAEALRLAESPEIKEILRLTAEGIKQDEIAKAMGISVDTVGRRLRSYRTILQRNGWHEGSGTE